MIRTAGGEALRTPGVPATGLRFARQLSRLLQNLDHKLNNEQKTNCVDKQVNVIVV
jgi:hypothetical protein